MATPSFRPGIIIPVYNHGKTLAAIVAELAPSALPIFIIDDGSDAETKREIAAVAAEFPVAELVALPTNSGKGAAVSAGILAAQARGLTHVLQLDADGQHDVSRVDFFLAQAALMPDCVICGKPEFGADAPAGRKYGRLIANYWAKIVTLSSAIVDVLCGFRVYPVAATAEIIRRERLDQRMGFDVEILVRLQWAGCLPRFFPVRVIYPPNGISHFDGWRDNARLTKVFTRLFFGMLWRLWRKRQ